jgi:hypothetical protein
MGENRKTSGITLRIVCAMLLVFLGFAHQPIASAAVAQDTASYMLPDGTVASLCLPDGEGKQGKQHADHGCEACRIASSVAMPAPPMDAADIAPVVAAVLFVFAPERFHRLNFPPNAPPRGPPAIPVSFVTA